MSGFLYFKPGRDTVTIADIKEWGLGYAFGESVARCRCIANSPTGAGGITFADSTRLGDHEVNMNMPKQTWGKIPKSDIWVGFWNDAKPTPAELARPETIPGYFSPLADGNKWVIPLVRRFDLDSARHVSALPCYMTCDEKGNWVPGQVMEIHSHLWDLLTPFADDFIARMQPDNDGYEAKNFSDSEIYGAVTTLLQTNYVVGPAELSLIHAFVKTKETHDAILVACDFGVFWKWNADQKKTEQQLAPDGVSISAGEAA